MKLADFDTLTAAREYEEKSYSLIERGIATQFLGLNGIMSKIRDKVGDPTVVQVIPGVDTTLGEVCEIVIGATQTTGFACDPAETDGQLNRAAAAVLVENGILNQAQSDAFFSLGTTVRKPFESKTLFDFKLAKNTMTKKPLQVSAHGAHAIFTLTQETEAHSPRVTTSSGKELGRVNNVSAVGPYIFSIPNHAIGQPVWVDDAYGAI